VIILILIAIAVAAVVVAFLAMNTSTDSGAIQSVTQPDSASQVAAKLHCTSFKELGAPTASQDQRTVDSGSCMKDGTKYAINTFVSSDVRDSWLKAAEPLGVNPKWETSTSVTYKSVS
jgi:uncharacterized membrane protein YdfJ with MMPL/SSD domain